ncbi:MAG TPA: family 43 glycosylhydrolase [Acidimicrobiales bacterium]|nr:family 43 glycosylhydrolase [Acidimicrobiales bacterium]
MAGIAALALLTTGLLSDLHVRSELRQARSSLKATRSRLGITLKRLSSAEASLTSTTGERDTLQLALNNTSRELSAAEASLASTQGSLANANTGLAFQGIDITTLNTCLAGVEQALNQIAVGDQNGAVTSISAASSSCQTLQGQSRGGAVFPFDFPDPDVIRVGSIYYGYATNSAVGNIQMIQSTDLIHWTVDGNALPHLASWALPGYTWAPGVFELNGTFVLYYAAVYGLTGKECISVAVAADPRGPFVDSSTTPLVCQLDLGGSIDPSPFVDAAGTPYLTWKSQGAKGQAPTIWSQQLSADGTTLVGQAPTALLQASQGWEAGVVEGPSMLPWAGRYYLFYSANNWNSANYAIGVAVCQGPTGPCSKPFDHSIVVSQGTAMSGPGGPSLFTDTQGGLWIAFHAWLPSAVGYPHSRLLYLRQVTFTNYLPVVQSTPKASCPNHGPDRSGHHGRRIGVWPGSVAFGL